MKYRRNNIIYILLLIIISTAIFFNSLNNSFVWDDDDFIVKNTSIRRLDNWPGFFISRQTFSADGEFKIYRPLRNVTYALDYKFWKLNPAGYHISNTFYHTLCGIVLYFLTCLLLRLHHLSNSNSNKISFPAFLCALIFITHPVHTESVAFIKGRDDLLVTLFFLLAFFFYIKFRSAAPEKRFRYYILSIFSFILALFSKEMAITFPIVILSYDLYFYFNIREIFKNNIFIYIPFILINIVYFIIRTIVVGTVAQTGYLGGSAFITFLTLCKGTVYYIRLLLIPVNLCIDYMKFPVSTYPDLKVILSIAVIVCLILYTVKSYKNSRLLSFSILWFFITLLPVLGIVPIKIPIAERFLYLPSISLCLFVALVITFPFLFMVNGGGVRNISIIFIIISAFCSFLTAKRNTVWKNEIVLWKDAIEKAPGNDRAYHNLGVAYNIAKRYEQSLKFINKAIKLRERYNSPPFFLAKSLYNAGVASYNLGDYNKAIEYLNKAIENQPDNFLYHFELGVVYRAKGMINLTFKEYKRSIELNNSFDEVFNNAGGIYMGKGDFDRAERYLHIALRINPEYFEAQYNLGMIYSMKKDYDRAVSELHKAANIESDNNYFANYGLANAYSSKRMYNEAIKEFKTVLKRKHDFFDAHYGLADIYQHVLSDYEKAMYHLKEYRKYIRDEVELLLIEDRMRELYRLKEITVQNYCALPDEINYCELLLP